MSDLDRGSGQPYRHPAGRTCLTVLPLALVWLLGRAAGAGTEEG